MTTKQIKLVSDNKRFDVILRSYMAQRLTVTLEYGEKRRVTGRIYAMHQDCLELAKENGFGVLIKHEDIEGVSRRTVKK